MNSNSTISPESESQLRGLLSVVVADDNVDAAVSLAKLLELSGFPVVAIAHNGPTALEAVLRHQPRVALLDIALPGMDGYEVARRIRERLGNATRLVAVTGLARVADRMDASEAGFNAHFVKPVEWVGLKDLLVAFQHEIEFAHAAAV
jgi:two-component system CheB/CheR fusion protein